MDSTITSLDLKNKSILIVEDDIVNFEYLRELLQMARAKIIHAVTGQQAMDLFNSQEFDAVLLDIKIPPPDGLEVAKYIRNSVNKHVPIIVQSALAFKHDKQECMQAGCNEYITKPFPMNELFEKLGKHIN